MSDLVTTTYDHQTLLDHAVEIARASKAPNTVRAYASDFRRFADWCAKHGLDALPAKETTIGAYLVHLSHTGHKPTTINRAITAINQAHLCSGWDRPARRMVREIYRGINRLKGSKKRRVQPITWPILCRMLNVIKASDNGMRDRALLLVGFACALRRSELVAIDFENLEFVAEGVILHQYKSKTNQTGEERKIAIPFLEVENMCPVRALRRLIDYFSISEGALFRGTGSTGRLRHGKLAERRLSAQGVALIIKRYCSAAGYNPDQYSGHSLRAGFITSAAAAGLKSAEIMARTGHKNFEVFFNYVRDGRLFLEHPLLSIVNSAPID